MTTTSPTPSLVEVIRRAVDEWYDDDNTKFMESPLQDHIAAAVAAHLASPEVVERMRGSIYLAMKARCQDRAYCATADECSCYGDSLSEARAAVAAVVWEAGNGGE